MNKIKLLPPNLINQIAAGEVIERPASVVKELLENSIDAEATEIQIEIEEGGLKLIKITDNGIGMSKEDAQICLKKHATSKITVVDDLFSKIYTLGFRGEALASISSISHFTLITKTKDSTEGYKIYSEGGENEKFEPCSANTGTQIEVRSLFFNVPARRKYLKTESTEYRKILDTVQKAALANEDVAFKLFKDGKEVMNLPRANNLRERIYDLFGARVADAMLEVFYESTDIKLSGFVGKPELAKSNRSSQYIFVNSRVIESGTVSAALKHGYRTTIAPKLYPFCVLKFEINPKNIDVNVHPTKKEIRFDDERALFRIVSGVSDKAMKENVLSPQVSFEREADIAPPSFNPNPEPAPKIASARTVSFNVPKPKFNPSYKPSLLERKESIKAPETFESEAQEEVMASMIPLAQVAKSYILAQDQEGLVIIDQHAAHERVMQVKLVDEFEKKKPATQELIVPVTVELTHQEISVLEENIGNFEKLGFKIEHFGGNSFNLEGIPNLLSKDDVGKIFKEMLEDILSGKEAKGVETVKDRIINFMACRSAIKFGQKLTHEEQVGLIKEMENTREIYSCPHGRPTMIRLTFNELEKKFHRD